MSRAQSWLAAVAQAGGDDKPPPDPRIPANYLQKPQRQHPAFAHTELSPPPHLPLQPKAIARPNRKRAALAEIQSPNELHPNKRQRIPNDCKTACAMSKCPKSPLKPSRKRSSSNASGLQGGHMPMRNQMAIPQTRMPRLGQGASYANPLQLRHLVHPPPPSTKQLCPNGTLHLVYPIATTPIRRT